MDLAISVVFAKFRTKQFQRGCQKHALYVQVFVKQHVKILRHLLIVYAFVTKTVCYGRMRVATMYGTSIAAAVTQRVVDDLILRRGNFLLRFNPLGCIFLMEGMLHLRWLHSQFSGCLRIASLKSVRKASVPGR